MDSGFYAAYTGLISRMQELDVLAHNLANVNTTGYKAGHEVFSEILMSKGGSPLNRAVNDFLQSDDGRKQLAKIWMHPTGGTPQHLADYIKSENAKWGPIIKKADIHL